MTSQWHVSYQRDDGFTLELYRVPLRYLILEDIVFGLCKSTGNRFCHWLCNKVGNVVWKHTDQVRTIPIDRDIADEISGQDAWSWLDEPENND